jgi:hypothetical protein
VAQLYPETLGSLSIDFYDSRGYGGGNSNPPPRPGGPVCYTLRHKFEADRIQNTAPNSTSNLCSCSLPRRHDLVKSSLMLRPTVSRSACFNIAPIWGLRPDFYYCQTVAGLLMWGALSDERTGLLFTIAAGPRQIRDFPFCRLLRLTGLRWRY